MPAGRPKGAKNKRPTMTAALKNSIPGGRQHFRPDQEFFQGKKHITMNVDAISHGCLSIHARRRHIPLSWLIQDILNLWLAASTDYDQAIFRDLLPPNARAARTPERFVGYIESLGFAEAPQQTHTNAPTAQDIPLPQAIAPTYQPPTQGQAQIMTHPSLADMSTPYRHPLTTGPASYPHPAPSLPHNAQVFDPQSQPQRPGSGSAAQDIETRGTPQDELPAIDPKLQEMLDFYHVDTKDIR